MEFTPRQLANLNLILDTFAPGDGANVPSASDVDAASLVAFLAGQNPRASEKRQLQMVLGAWDSRAVAALLVGRPRKFSRLNQEQREAVLLRMKNSPLVSTRGLYGALKDAALQTYYLSGGSGLWDSLGYDGVLGIRADAPPPPLKPAHLTGDTTIDCDVVIVGSGAGGGTAAGVLAAAGLDVVVLEAGEYYDDRDFDGSEKSGFTRMYAQAPVSTIDGSIALVAGRGLGGGTVVNYTTSFRTPDHVRKEWADLGAKQFADQEYAESMDAVEDRLSVNSDFQEPGQRDVVLERGAQKLGWSVGAMPRNVRNCAMGAECGRCGMGCRVGAKQSTTKTWLADAAAAGARLYVGVSARRVLTSGGQATGVEAHSADGHTLTVHARAVVVAAGAIQTPALLKRSGLPNPNIGSHLRLHPVAAVWGEMDQEIRPWEGILQGRYVDEFRDMDGDGYGILLETGPTTPTLASVFIGWEGGRQHLARMQSLRHIVPTAVLVRDRDSVGTVKIGRDGEPVVSYRLSPHDAGHLQRGMGIAAEALVAGGAKSVFTSHPTPVTGTAAEIASGAFSAGVQKAGTRPGRLALACLHIMGSARMGGSAATSALDPDGQTWDVKGLYVADGSNFPTASGVNPMISIEAIAHMVASRLAAQLT
jgi:choline dehydrogenase-like flavoprotein